MVKKSNGLSLELIIHPGEILRDILEERKMTQKELAIRTDVTEPHISKIVNGQKAISVRFAKKLEYALGIDAPVWINLQAIHDSELADFEEMHNISIEEMEILKKIEPITFYMQEEKLIESDLYGPDLLIAVRKKMNISSLERITDISQPVVYRLGAANIDYFTQFIWLRMTELISARQNVSSELNVKRLRKIIPELKKLMFLDEVEIEKGLKENLSSCGIKFSIVKHFAGVPVQGVIRVDSDNSLSLVMTNRRKFADEFWFTFFHELGHIINGDVQEKFIDYENGDKEKEEKADKFAAEILMKEEEYKAFVKNQNFSLSAIKEFAKVQRVPPFILIGRLQNDRHLEWNMLSEEKTRYTFD